MKAGSSPARLPYSMSSSTAFLKLGLVCDIRNSSSVSLKNCVYSNMAIKLLSELSIPIARDVTMFSASGFARLSLDKVCLRNCPMGASHASSCTSFKHCEKVGCKVCAITEVTALHIQDPAKIIGTVRPVFLS